MKLKIGESWLNHEPAVTVKLVVGIGDLFMKRVGDASSLLNVTLECFSLANKVLV